MRTITVALAGNPNAGKTTIFNALTGSRQHVGNYAGVTVEKKEGFADYQGMRIKFVDLPGTYSLSANSPEEVVARNYLVMEKPDLVVQVVDASNLDRNLYLGTQIMELDLPLLFALNMYDMAKSRGIVYNVDEMSALLNAPVVPTIGNKRKGMDDLLKAIVQKLEQPKPVYQKITYPKELDKPVEEIEQAIRGKDRELADKFPAKWMAVRLLENDPDLITQISDPALKKKVTSLRSSFASLHENPPEVMTTEAKYGWIAGLCARAVDKSPEANIDASDRADKILLHRVLGLPIFLLLMYAMFWFVFTVAEKPMDWIESMFVALGQYIAHFWPKSAESPLRDLLVDGIIGGVGGVLVFLPNIVLLFFSIAFLEGTGYMARAAFIMDRIMSRIGLPGKSFIPMLLGFGCTVPAIMATRTIENWKDRLTTILVLPLMSCGARLPIYMLIVPAFFPKQLNAWMVWLIYVIGIAFAIIGAKVLRKTLLKGEATPFIMELPPYRMPTLRSVIIQMWERAWEYVKKAGTVILGVSILLWAMTAYPKKPGYSQDYEQRATEARAAYEKGLAEVGSQLGVSSATMMSWSDNEAMFADAEESFWKHEAGYGTAETRYENRRSELFAGQGGGTLSAFVRAVKAIDEIDARFDEDVEGMDEESYEYRLAETVKESEIEKLDLSADVFAAVDKYRSGVRAEREEAEEEIMNGQRGEDIAYSVSGRIGHAIEPVLRPLGFDWRVGTALIGSFAAKEVFVAQMGIVFSVGEADEGSEGLREKLRASYTRLQAFCMMLFCLLSLPCVATIAVARRETGGWKWPLFMGVSLSVLAYVATMITYQVGSALGVGLG